jgi:hypothetical protein
LQEIGTFYGFVVVCFNLCASVAKTKNQRQILHQISSIL